jgi:hypothetical protein
MADELQGKEEGKAELLAATAITRARVAEDIAALAAKLFVAGAFDLEEAARTSAASGFVLSSF